MGKVLILGAKGMLGGALAAEFGSAALLWDREDIDVTDFKNLESRILNLETKPRAMINCVAYNDVDGAEKNRGIAFKLNTEVPGELASMCNELSVPFIHFSTNYIFNGKKGEYTETDVPSPLSVYAESKALGEQEVQKNTDQFYIVRTAVLFGPKGKSEMSKKSFVDLMLEKSAQSDTIKAVADEINSVTYVKDLAQKVLQLLSTKAPFGIYHITNSGSASWYDIAKEIFRITNKQISLLPVPSTEFPRAAKRPAKSVLLNTKFPQMRSWQEALREFLKTQSL